MATAPPPALPPPALPPADPADPDAPPPPGTVVTLPPAGGERTTGPAPAAVDDPAASSTPTATPADIDGSGDNGSDGDPECFPADAAVALAAGGGVARAADLGWGTRVATPDAPAGGDGGSPLLVWTHAHPTARSCNFVTLTTAAGPAVTLTGGHLVPVGVAAAAVLTPADRKSVV